MCFCFGVGCCFCWGVCVVVFWLWIGCRWCWVMKGLLVFEVLTVFWGVVVLVCFGVGCGVGLVLLCCDCVLWCEVL